MPQNQTHSFCFLSIVKVLKASSATGQKYLFDEFGATNFLALIEGVTHFGPSGIQDHWNVRHMVGINPGMP